MKSTTAFLTIIGLLAAGGSVSVVYSRSKIGEVLSSVEQFTQLKAGDRILYLCRQCDSRREVTLTSMADAAERFKDGTVIICPGCKDKMRVVIGPRTDLASRLQPYVRFVNEKGGECMYVAKAPSRK